MKSNRRIVEAVVVAVVICGIFLIVSCNQGKRIANYEYLKEFLKENGKLVELFDEGVSDGVQIVSTETGWIPVYERDDIVDAMTDFPVLLYYPDSSKVRVHFEMDLSPRFEKWELYVGEKLVPSDPEKEYYYFLDLEEKGTYIMDVRYQDPESGEGHIYFSIAW